MNAIDYAVLAAYFLLMIVAGLVLARRAGKGVDAYFLGGRAIPWWALGISGMATFVDMTGTMLIASFFYIVGVKGLLVEFRGGVALIMAFLMVFMGKWHTRSRVMTTAEWMEFRFGPTRQADAARLMNAAVNIILTVAMIGYFFVGSGKFLSLFLPWPPFVCAVLLTGVCLFYTVLGGFYAVVYTDVMQAALIAFMTVFVSVKAFFAVDAGRLAAVAPAGWTDLVPRWKMNFPPGYEIYDLFLLSVSFFLLKVVIEGFAGQQSIVSQRYFAVRTDRDAGRLSALWTAAMTFRWPFIMAVAVLGLTLGDKVREPEMVLPAVFAHLIPAGLKGLLIAGLIAAAMSTFDSIINGGAAYVVRDVYKKFLRPGASDRGQMRASYVASALIAVAGILVGVATPSINAIWGWITMSFGAGMLVPLVFRWYWWRFNGAGYALGTGVGIAAAVAQKLLFPGLPEWGSFLTVGALSAAASLAGTFAYPPADRATLAEFYARTRPFGFWGPVRAAADPVLVAETARETRADFRALALAVPWQLTMFLTPIYLVIHKLAEAAVCGTIFALTSVGLYFAWYRRLKG